MKFYILTISLLGLSLPLGFCLNETNLGGFHSTQNVDNSINTINDPDPSPSHENITPFLNATDSESSTTITNSSVQISNLTDFVNATTDSPSPQIQNTKNKTLKELRQAILNLATKFDNVQFGGVKTVEQMKQLTEKMQNSNNSFKDKFRIFIVSMSTQSKMNINVTHNSSIRPVSTTPIPSNIKKYVPQECQEPLRPGKCLASVPSWYFNTGTGTCEPFIYGGCDGNSNRFKTDDECENFCLTVPQGREQDEEESPNVVSQESSIDRDQMAPEHGTDLTVTCETLQCFYGVLHFNRNGGKLCQCKDPCEEVTCDEGFYCDVTMNHTARGKSFDHHCSAGPPNPSSATLYNKKDKNGNSEEFNPNLEPTPRCHNLTIVAGNLNSIEPFSSCVRLYQFPDCEGFQTPLYPGQGHGAMRLSLKKFINFDVHAIGPCQNL